MTNHNTVFNDQMELFGLRYVTKVAPIPPGDEFNINVQRKKLLAVFFEQLLLFDSVVIKLERSNLGLQFLINEFGLDKVEVLIEKGTIKLLLWTPIIVTSIGMSRDDGTIDDSMVLGSPPLVTGAYIEADSDPEKNIETALSYFRVDRERKRRFIRIVRDKYLFPNNELASGASNVILDAYKSNRLESLGLKYEKEPEYLTVKERGLLQKLGHDVLDTSILADMGFKSYNKHAVYDITESSIKKIESAIKVSNHTAEILKIENVPDIKSLYMDDIVPFDVVFAIRHKTIVKDYRKWINSVSNTDSALNIAKEYIDEVTGKNKFFESNKGKFVRNVGVFVVGGGIGAALGGIPDAVVGATIGQAANLGLGLFDTYILDGILKGWNPRMFVDEIRKQQNIEDNN